MRHHLLDAPGGACRDTALAENVCATRKAELLDTRPWPTRGAARLAPFAWLAVWYNHRRRRSALTHRSPVAYEEQVVSLHNLAA